MSQNKKITSRKTPYHQTLSVCSLLSLAVIGANSAQAVETDFGVYYQASAYVVQSDAFETPATGDAPANGERDNGIANLLRLKADFRDEQTGVSLHTSIELAGDRWAGDDLDYNQTADEAFNTDNRGSNVRLDLGYVQIPIDGNLLRVGRQATSWNNCLLVCDDRRDRILLIVPTGIGNFTANYDRRGDTDGFFNDDNGDMAAVGYTTKLSDFTLGLLYVHWFENHSGLPRGYALQGADIFSPYLEGNVADLFDFSLGIQYMGNNEITYGGAPGTEGLIFEDSAFSEYLRIGKSLGPVQLDLQWVGAQDGGLVSPGFNTYSSIINSSPESTANPTSMYRMGGANGLKDFDESLIIGRVGFDVTPKWTISGAVGRLSIDNGTNDDSSMVYDLQASYQLNSAVRTWATVGMLTENEVGVLSGNPLIETSTATKPFAEDDVLAASLNLAVEF